VLWASKTWLEVYRICVVLNHAHPVALVCEPASISTRSGTTSRLPAILLSPPDLARAMLPRTHECDALDARIYALEHELARLKRKRNQFAFLLCLPTEIIVAIVKESLPEKELELPGALYALTSVCSHLRFLLIDTPSLWTLVNFFWKYKSADQIDLFMNRSAQYPLRVVVPIDEDFEDADERIIPCLTRAYSIKVLFFSGSFAQRFLDTLESLDPFALERLDLRADALPELEELVILSPEFISAAMCRTLVTLRIFKFFVSGFPRLPCLRNLHIDESVLSIADLHGLLSHTPLLQSVRLTNILYIEPEPDSPFVPRALLPRLEYVELSSYDEAVASMINVIPNPRLGFVVDLQGPLEGPLTPCSSSTGISGLVASRLREFRPGDWPSGVVNSTISRGTTGGAISFRTAPDITPSLLYGAAYTAFSHDPMLSHIVHVDLFCQGHPNTMPHMQSLETFLNHFPSLASLSIHRPNWELDDGQNACTRAIEGWLTERDEKGQEPFPSIRFRHCVHDLREFCFSLKDRCLVSRVKSSLDEDPSELEGSGSEDELDSEDDESSWDTEED
jgi:hypothetical protein